METNNRGMGMSRGIVIVFQVLLLGITSCAVMPKKWPEVVWPSSPEKPRIKFIASYKYVEDLGESTWNRFVTKLTGRNPRVLFRKPYGVAVTNDGIIYVTDTIGSIVIIDPKKHRPGVFMPETVSLRTPVGIAYDNMTSTLFVSDVTLNRVFGFDKKGKTIWELGAEEKFENPAGIFFDENDRRLYVVDSQLHKVFVHDGAGKGLFEIGRRGVENGEFNFPANVWTDRDSIYVVDTMNFRVQIFDKKGGFKKSIGKLGDVPGSFARPKGIALDNYGHIYVVDAAFANFQIFDRKGNLLLFIGGNGEAPGQFILPAGIFIDRLDRIYVVDQLNTRVQEFQYSGGK